MATHNQASPAIISWEGDAFDKLRSWPKPIQFDFGTSLREMQHGRAAKLNVRPMQSIGDGVFELKDADAARWYRMIYLARIDDVIYVLDCFEKDTAKTERKDLKRASVRLAKVRQRLMGEKRDAKRKRPQ